MHYINKAVKFLKTSNKASMHYTQLLIQVGWHNVLVWIRGLQTTAREDILSILKKSYIYKKLFYLLILVTAIGGRPKPELFFFPGRLR